MDYQQFVSEVEVRVKQQVESGMSVHLQTSIKNNGITRIGIVLTEQGSNVSPTIYLEEFFEEFQREQSFDCVVKHIMQTYKNARMEKNMDVEIFREFDKTREQIVYKLINAKKNHELLDNVPHRTYLDLAIVYYVIVDMDCKGTATILITKEIEKMWGVTEQLLYETAHENSRELLPVLFQTLHSVLEEMMGMPHPDAEIPMYVLTNEQKCFGASCVLYDHVLMDIANQLNESFYLIPSSVHEFLIMPESKSPTVKELEEMIREVNDTQVEEEEILSYHAYYYDKSKKGLLLYF